MSVSGRALLGAMVALCCWVSALADPGTALRLVREDVRIAAAGGYDIDATIIRPQGPGPFGAVVLNHGFSADEKERQSESWQAFAAVAPVFARRGYAVIMPIRRGFGTTGGELAEDPGSCLRPHFFRGEQAAADDVMAAYDYARSLAYVDPQRMILAGQSAGGMVALFTAAMREPQGLLAVLGFAAGRGGGREPGVPCAAEALGRVFDAIGARVKVPVLLHYAQNDQFFGPGVSRTWFERLLVGGAQAEYVLQPPYGRDGHFVFTQLGGVEYWLPAVERFFGEHAVPFARLDAGDPLVKAKLPGTSGCESLYRVFLESPAPRAYALSDDGHCGFAGGVDNAAMAAMRECGEIAETRCALYAVDDRMLWVAREHQTLRAGLDATLK